MFTIDDLDKNIIEYAREDDKCICEQKLIEQLENLYNKMSQVGGDYYPQTDVILGKRMMLLEVINFLKGLE